ncbi:hypothetical protein P3S68_033337 [Capsicum galapagoense]
MFLPHVPICNKLQSKKITSPAMIAQIICFHLSDLLYELMVRVLASIVGEHVIYRNPYYTYAVALLGVSLILSTPESFNVKDEAARVLVTDTDVL